MEFSTFSLKALKKAAKALGSAVALKPQSQIVKDGVIQRFEYTYELAWKTVKRYFASNQRSLDFHVKDIWREAAKIGLIDDVEPWFEFHKARNETSHTYDRKVANSVYTQAKKFSREIKKLISKLESALDE